MRTSKCPHCGRTAEISYEEVVRIGVPMCECAGDAKAMVLWPANKSKPTLTVVVEMFGGTINAVYHNNPNVEIQEVIFLEDQKYLDGEDDRDQEGKLRFSPDHPDMEDCGVYSVETVVEVNPEQVAACIEAARKREGDIK